MKLKRYWLWFAMAAMLLLPMGCRPLQAQEAPVAAEVVDENQPPTIEIGQPTEAEHVVNTETPPDDAEGESPSGGSSWWWDPILDALSKVATIIVSLALALLAFFLQSKFKLEGAEKRALDYIKAGVNETWETYVREIKHGLSDRKLTDAERKLAMEKALAKAKELAASAGDLEVVALLKEKGTEWAKAKVEQWLIVIKSKVFGGKEESKTS